ncbi:hypothetical protein BpHYR1_025775 [Brachionus plicatilis]|uniref:Uncharacterized protein n=1 Tax=Brachionus plicatilis TaxID=10195 RepID=A0A3M7RV73_BRAPC|nr:hypothetical protein BpHYR1_025775 [Brachionus plicatilis]
MLSPMCTLALLILNSQELGPVRQMERFLIENYLILIESRTKIYFLLAIGMLQVQNRILFKCDKDSPKFIDSVRGLPSTHTSSHLFYSILINYAKLAKISKFSPLKRFEKEPLLNARSSKVAQSMASWNNFKKIGKHAQKNCVKKFLNCGLF